jgi:hypothetical protein
MNKRKVVINKQVSNGEKNLSPEGASISDICSFVDKCNDEKCPLYHPVWAVNMCIKYVKDECKTKNCRLIHMDWEDLLVEAKDPDNRVDFFSGKSFVKANKSKVTIVKSSLESNSNKSNVVQEYAIKLGDKKYMGGNDLSLVDESAFLVLNDCENIISNGNAKELIRWYKEIKELMATDAF